MDSNTSRPVPPANTGSALLNCDQRYVACLLLQLERRIDPLFRPAFDALLRDPLARLTTALINRQRPRRRPEDRRGAAAARRGGQPRLDHRELHAADERLWKPGGFERGGNTKTQGIVRGEFIVHDDLPEHMRRGIYAVRRPYPAWVRFSGPGPYVTPDIDDVGFMSISVKLMGVPGPKLMDEEQFTQDMFGVSTPTFVTPDATANAQLQKWSVKNASIFYFVNLRAARAGPDHAGFASRRRAARSRRRTSAACRT